MKVFFKRGQYVIASLVLFSFVITCTISCSKGYDYAFYGVPTGELIIDGTVQDQFGTPLSGIEISVRDRIDIVEFTLKTDSLGQYSTVRDIIPFDSIWVIATDVEGIENRIINADSIRVALDFDRSGASGWFEGIAKVTANFNLIRVLEELE